MVTLYKPLTEYNNQIKIFQTVATRSNRSYDPTFMLNVFTNNVTALSRPPLTPLSLADT